MRGVRWLVFLVAFYLKATAMEDFAAADDLGDVWHPPHGPDTEADMPTRMHLHFKIGADPIDPYYWVISYRRMIDNNEVLHHVHGRPGDGYLRNICNELQFGTLLRVYLATQYARIIHLIRSKQLSILFAMRAWYVTQTDKIAYL